MPCGGATYGVVGYERVDTRSIIPYNHQPTGVLNTAQVA